MGEYSLPLADVPTGNQTSLSVLSSVDMFEFAEPMQGASCTTGKDGASNKTGHLTARILPHCTGATIYAMWRREGCESGITYELTCPYRSYLEEELNKHLELIIYSYTTGKLWQNKPASFLQH